MPIDRATGQPRGFAFVEFSDASVVQEAISKFDGTELQGRMLKVNEARDRAPRPRGDFGGLGTTHHDFLPPDRREAAEVSGVESADSRIALHDEPVETGWARMVGV